MLFVNKIDSSEWSCIISKHPGMLLKSTLLFTCLPSLLLDAGLKRESCPKELQETIARPNECAQSYLESLNDKLKRQTDLLFSSRQQEVISSFENTFGVSVSVNSPFPYGSQSNSNVTGETCIQFVNDTVSIIPSIQDYYIYFGNTA